MKYLIFGASSGIAQAIIQHLLQQVDTEIIVEQWRGSANSQPANTQIVRQIEFADPCDKNADLSPFFKQTPDVIINCIGLLHEQSHLDNSMTEITPEKCLEQLKDTALMRLMQVNTLSNVHIAQAITRYVPRKHPLKFIALSALVGSISQNKLGGWYSYRMSKAALNMFIQTLSIEWKRRLPNAICSAVHPGTTETALSQQFLRNHPKEKLYSAAKTAERIISIASNLSPENSGKLLMWDGTEIQP